MITGGHLVRVWACTRPIDLRLGYNGLTSLVASYFGEDLLKGDAFLFVNANRSSAKVLWWDGTGLVLYCKKLAGSRFARLWDEPGGASIGLSVEELALFLRGADFEGKMPWPRAFRRRTG